MSTATGWTGAVAESPRPQRLLIGFLVVEFACQLGLLLPAFNQGVLRALWRIGIFALSIAFVFLLRGRTRSSPATIAALWVMALIGLELFNPSRNNWASALAQVAMYLAVLGPLFWISRLQVSHRTLRRVLLLFWGFYTASTLTGLLQVYFPGRFQPPLSPITQRLGASLQGLKIVLANGATIFRPMGLTDTPGGAASAGVWAVLFGLGFLLSARQQRQPRWKQAMFVAGMVAGMMCIYLSQIRVLVVLLALCFGALLLLLLWRGRWRQFGLLAALVLAIGGGGLLLSSRVAGRGVTQRFATISDARRAAQTFEQERAGFLVQTVQTLIPDFPLGAGLGRWGMMNNYFGNPRSRNASIYVEIQWQGWVLDGGVVMLGAYLILLALTMLSLLRIARRRGPLALWAALGLAYDVAVLALCFDYTPFTGQMGLEFWFINALLLTAAATAARADRREAALRARWRRGPWAGHWRQPVGAAPARH